jgi:hypothetical protein
LQPSAPHPPSSFAPRFREGRTGCKTSKLDICIHRSFLTLSNEYLCSSSHTGKPAYWYIELSHVRGSIKKARVGKVEKSPELTTALAQWTKQHSYPRLWLLQNKHQDITLLVAPVYASSIRYVNQFSSSEKKSEYISTTRERKKKILYAFLKCFPNLRCLAHPILHVYSCFMMMTGKEKDMVFRCLLLLWLWLFLLPCLIVLPCRSSVGPSAENHLRAAAGWNTTLLHGEAGEKKRCRALIRGRHHDQRSLP